MLMGNGYCYNNCRFLMGAIQKKALFSHKMAVHGVIRMQINDGKYKVAAHQNRLPNYVNININAG